MQNTSFLYKFLQQSLAPSQHILPGGLEVASIPRVRHIARAVCMIHQEGHLVGEIAAADVVHTSQIGLIHTDEQVVLLVILIGELPGRMTLAGDSMLRQLLPSRGINRAANLLSAGSRGFDVELRFLASLLHQVLHYELGHRAATNIAMTHKKQLFHAD